MSCSDSDSDDSGQFMKVPEANVCDIEVNALMPNANSPVRIRLRMKYAQSNGHIQPSLVRQEKERILDLHKIPNPQNYVMKIYFGTQYRKEMADDRQIAEYSQDLAMGTLGNVIVFEHGPVNGQ